MSKIMKYVGMLLLLASLKAHSAITVITSEALEDYAMTTQEVYRVITYRMRRWASGYPVTVVLLPRDHSATYELANLLFNRDPGDLFSIITMYQRKVGNDLIYVDTEVEMILTVETTKGAIGYANGRWYLNDKVRIIDVTSSR